MTKEELDKLLELKEKVDMYERAFLDLLFAVKTDKTIIVPQTGNVTQVWSRFFTDLKH